MEAIYIMFANTKSIVILVVCLFIGIGYYAWRQQQQSFAELRYLQSSGVNIAFSLVTRPLLAVDRESQVLYLLSGKGEHTVEKIPFVQIAAIEFIEAPINSPKQSSPERPDTISITLMNGTKIRVGDLRKNARYAKALFDEHHVLTDKSSLKLRR